MPRPPDFLVSGPDVVGNRLDLTVWVATVERQAELDRRYAPG